MLLYLGVAAVLAFLLYLYFTKDNDYWKRQGITYVEPHCLVGNFLKPLLRQTSVGLYIVELYNKYQDEPFIGIYNMRKPTLLVRDVEVAKSVLSTEFNKFHDNPFNVDEDVDPIIAKNPFILNGERWKMIRGQLSPQLTSAKMKAMFPLIQQTCKDLVKYLSEEPKARDQNGLDARELSLKYTSDNVASCAFGLEGNSFQDPNADFRKMAEKFMQRGTWANVVFMFITFFPELATTVRLPFGDKSIADKFKVILGKTIKYRQENNVVRHDFLDSIIELKQKKMPFEYTEDYMVAHCMTFFIDGSDTSSLVMCHALYELAVNIDVQDRLRKEVDAALAKNNGNLTYEAVQELPYLDAVFQESLRKYAPLMVISRVCTQDCTLTAPDGKSVKMEKGKEVLVPIAALHMDPKLYPDPDRFDPDRFTPEAKHPLPGCFLGFGLGPRTCLGQRFAIMQLKAGIATLVSNFEIRPSKKTKIPLEVGTTLFILQVTDGIWMNFHKRK